MVRCKKEQTAVAKSFRKEQLRSHGCGNMKEHLMRPSIYLFFFPLQLLLFSNQSSLAGRQCITGPTHTHTLLSRTLTPSPTTANRAPMLLAAAIPGFAFWRASSHSECRHQLLAACFIKGILQHLQGCDTLILICISSPWKDVSWSSSSRSSDEPWLQDRMAV